jgi:hypothetical protein
MRVPITVKCQCGHVTQALAGDEVTCECGRVYETRLSNEQVGALTGLEQRMRVFARLGTGVVGLFALGGFLLLNTWAGVLALLVGGGLWWVVLQPMWRRRAAAELGTLPPAIVEPK